MSSRGRDSGRFSWKRIQSDLNSRRALIVDSDRRGDLCAVLKAEAPSGRDVWVFYAGKESFAGASFLLNGTLSLLGITTRLN